MRAKRMPSVAGDVSALDIARMLIPFLMFGGSLVALLVAAHYFTAAAERVGLALGMC